jgi:hypothetical protein
MTEFPIGQLRQRELLDACLAISKLLDDGLLVRDISRDDEPGFAIRSLNIVMALKKLNDAIEFAEQEK